MKFYDKHNMVAFLKKPQRSEDFHQIVDFLNASHIRTLDNGEIELNATVDGQDKTITKACVKRHLKLADADDISTLPTTEIFKQLASMGNMKRESRGFSGVETTLFMTMLVNEQLSQGEDETITKEMHDGLGMATTTASSLEAEQGSEKVTALENELKSTKAVYNKSLITLTKRVKKLEKKIKHKKRTIVDSSDDEEESLDKEDSPKQGRMIKEIDEDENVNLVKSSKQREAHETVGSRKESDDSDVKYFSTASPQNDDDEITLAETLVNIKKSAAKDKGEAIMQESEPPNKFKKKEMIQICLDEEIAQRMLEEEKDSLSIEERSRLLTKFIDQRKMMLAAKRVEEQRNKPHNQAQQRTYMSNYIKNIGGYTLKQLKKYSFKEIKILKEGESLKRPAKEELGQEQQKKEKVKEGLSKERLQEMMVIIPEQGIHVEALQTKYPVIDSKIYTEGTRQYWKIIRVGNITEERFSSSNPTEDKEIALWVELKRLFEPDEDDELWKFESFELIWRLYDWFGVHHISTRDGHDIFMQVEKEYPLSRGALLMMLVQKLQVDEHNEMAENVIKNGSSFKPVAQTVEGSLTPQIPGLVTADEKIQKKKNDVKARSMLLMALPNEHLMTFNQYKDAKSLFDAITTRFGGNDANRKTQKTLLKQMYENFITQSRESLDSIFNRLQKIVSQLAVLDIDKISNDDLYKNFKIVKQNVKRNAGPSSISVSQNMAFVSTPSTSNNDDVSIVFRVSTASPQENRTRNQETTRRTVNVEDTSSKAMVAIDGAGFDWSYMADDEAPTNMAFMAFSGLEYDELRVEFNKSECNLTNYKRGLALVEEQLVHYKKNESLLNENIDVLNRDILIKDSEIAFLTSRLGKISKEKNDIETKIEKFENASQGLDKLIESQITNKSKRGLGYVSYNVVPPPHTGMFLPPGINLSHTGLPEFAEPSVESYGVKPIEVVTQTSSVKISEPVKENNDAPLIEDWESEIEYKVESPPEMKRKTVKPSVDKVEVDIPKQNDKPARILVQYAEMYRTQRPRVLIICRLGANTIRGKGWHMTGNIFYLTDFMEFDGGYVAFRRGYKGGKVTGKGIIRTGKLDFEDVYFVKELKFNLFSVSQMCGKKNNFFTDTECFVLSPDFKLADESHVLLKVSRKNNMYSVDMKNIVPRKKLTCLFVKATNNESMLWHRRLGHITFKNINKLVKENLVRGLTSKCFENDQTCVACLNGKQHNISFKSKI
nr:putative ribonuclease H-like domain-containing protein [Tanacetum cinerariifolium]